MLPWVVEEVLLRTCNAPRAPQVLEEEGGLVWFSSDLNLVPITILVQQDQGPGVVSVNCPWEKERLLRQDSRLDIEHRHRHADDWSPWYATSHPSHRAQLPFST